MGIKVECQECNKVFETRRVNNVRCPRCGSRDVDLAEPCPGWIPAEAKANAAPNVARVM